VDVDDVGKRCVIKVPCVCKQSFAADDLVEFPLTGKEFHILELLMRNPNQVIGRERLLAHAWDFNYTSFTNVVDVHINSIRKKLHLHKEHELVTVHGVGYKLVSNPQSS
jgi:DNA-binding response OmpR family regulator